MNGDFGFTVGWLTMGWVLRTRLGRRLLREYEVAPAMGDSYMVGTAA